MGFPQTLTVVVERGHFDVLGPSLDGVAGNQLFQTDDAKKVENVFKDILYSPPLYKARRMASTYDLEAVDGKEVERFT